MENTSHEDRFISSVLLSAWQTVHAQERFVEKNEMCAL